MHGSEGREANAFLTPITERVNYFVTPVLGGPPPQGEILRSLTFVRDDTAV